MISASFFIAMPGWYGGWMLFGYFPCWADLSLRCW